MNSLPSSSAIVKSRKGKATKSSFSAKKFPLLFTPELFGTLRYAYYSQFTATTTNTARTNFRANSLYDPDATGIGAQPRYFDQLCSSSLYRRYRVLGCTYTIVARNQGTDDALLLIQEVDDGVSLPSSSSDVFETSELGSTKLLYLAPHGATGSAVKFTRTVSIGTVLNVPQAEITTADQFAAAYNGNPTQSGFISVTTAADPIVGAGHDVNVYVTIEYHVLFTELADAVSQS
jgi:hypothetical protein